MTTTISNQVWLIANELEKEFELFCKQNDLQENDFSLAFFKNEYDKRVGTVEMETPFSYCTGFFVSWKDKDGNQCRVFNQSKSCIDFLFAKLASKMKVEKWQVLNGQLKKLA